MAGIFNMALGAGAAGAAWGVPEFAPEALSYVPTLVHTYGLETNAMLYSGVALVGVGMAQMTFGWLGEAVKAAKAGPRSRTDRDLDSLFLSTVSAMVAADALVTDTEIAMVVTMCMRFRGFEPSVVRVRKRIAAMGGDVDGVLVQLRREAIAIPDAVKDQLIQAGVWVCFADLGHAKLPVRFLGQLGEALAMAPDRVSGLKTSMEQAAAGLVLAAGEDNKRRTDERPGISAAGASVLGPDSRRAETRGPASAGTLAGASAGTSVFGTHPAGETDRGLETGPANPSGPEGLAGQANSSGQLTTPKRDEPAPNPFGRGPLVRPLGD